MRGKATMLVHLITIDGRMRSCALLFDP